MLDQMQRVWKVWIRAVGARWNCFAAARIALVVDRRAVRCRRTSAPKPPARYRQ
jgi:hypothetical protein